MADSGREAVSRPYFVAWALVAGAFLAVAPWTIWSQCVRGWGGSIEGVLALDAVRWGVVVLGACLVAAAACDLLAGRSRHRGTGRGQPAA